MRRRPAVIAEPALVEGVEWIAGTPAATGTVELHWAGRGDRTIDLPLPGPVQGAARPSLGAARPRGRARSDRRSLGPGVPGYRLADPGRRRAGHRQVAARRRGGPRGPPRGRSRPLRIGRGIRRRAFRSLRPGARRRRSACGAPLRRAAAGLPPRAGDAGQPGRAAGARRQPRRRARRPLQFRDRGDRPARRDPAAAGRHRRPPRLRARLPAARRAARPRRPLDAPDAARYLPADRPRPARPRGRRSSPSSARTRGPCTWSWAAYRSARSSGSPPRSRPTPTAPSSRAPPKRRSGTPRGTPSMPASCSAAGCRLPPRPPGRRRGRCGC